MELRKKVKRPQRYEPELLTRLDPTYVPRSTRPAFPIDHVEFNSALPPAKFPTLEYPSTAAQSEHSQTRSSGSDISALDSEAVMRQQLRADQDRLDLPYDALDGWGVEGGSQIQGQVSRLQQLEKVSRRDKEEKFARDLELSDGDNGKDDNARPNATPLWINLPIPLQLTIVDAMCAHLTVATALMRLRLTLREQRNILWQQKLRGRRRRKEDSSIETMQAEQLHLLLHHNNNDYRSDATKRSAFRKTFEDHLYMNINVDQDYHTITKKDLADARTFLRWKGLSPNLAGEWSALEDKDPANAPQLISALSETAPRAGPRLKLTMSLPNSEVPPKPSAATKHQAPAVAKSSGRTNATMPVKRVLFADKARAPKSTGVAVVGPTSEAEFESIRVLPALKLSRPGRYSGRKAGMLDNEADTEHISLK